MNINFNNRLLIIVWKTCSEKFKGVNKKGVEKIIFHLLLQQYNLDSRFAIGAVGARSDQRFGGIAVEGAISKRTLINK